MKRYLKKIKSINKMYTNYKWKERKITFGDDDPDKVFYIVRRANSKVGLFSQVFTNLGYIKYAVDRGYIPIITMGDINFSSIVKGSPVKNDWEHLFKQPFGYGLREISACKNIILGNGIIDNSVPYPGGGICYNDNQLRYWKNVANQYLIIKEDIIEEANMLAKELFGEKRILGVLMRGTDYVNSRPPKHPIQPTVKQAVEDIDRIMDEYRCECIYLATEDESIYKQLKERYGSRLLALDAKRYVTKKHENINDMNAKNEAEKQHVNRQYLINILLLSKCNCLIGGNAGGSQAALLLSLGYEYKYIYNLGVY